MPALHAARAVAVSSLRVGIRRRRAARGLLLLLLPLWTTAQEAPSPAALLAQRVNAYRAAQRLDAIPLSAALTRVADAHAQDLERHPPAGQCGLHSWSAAGSWGACCYTADHAQARCMWDKPREITGGAYGSAGFEIVYWASDGATPDEAVSGWSASPAHDGMLLNRGVWAGRAWKAMGVAVTAHYAVVWFGRERDTGGTPDAMALNR